MKWIKIIPKKHTQKNSLNKGRHGGIHDSSISWNPVNIETWFETLPKTDMSEEQWMYNVRVYSLLSP